LSPSLFGEIGGKPDRRKTDMWIGADPGGKDNFGLAILNDEGRFSTYCLSCADEAIERLTERPPGIGIDAPMWWSSGRSGDRRADQWIRTQYKISSGTVQTANSLRGAALVQGVLFAESARQKFPGVPITEAHPKALLLALGLGWSEFCSRFSIKGIAENEHRRDAVVSAVAAREGFEGRWPLDLSRERFGSEQDPSTYWLAPMKYFWPNV
jgi:predicted nuclease with RNAse H fold